jgi:AcrR family transcriptional regulator
MPRASRAQERRRELIPTVAGAFAELGYRRATTAELARRCGVQENVLYRLWPDKRAMFVAAIEHVYDLSIEIWERLLSGEEGDGRTAAERLLDYEAEHHGEFGLYRIVYAGLSETDDDQIRAALSRMYDRYRTFIGRRVREHRGGKGQGADLDAVAWALIGMGTMTSIGRELDLMPAAQRRRLWEQVGRQLLGPRSR